MKKMKTEGGRQYSRLKVLPRHPPSAPLGQVLALGDQTLMNRAGQEGDVVISSNDILYKHNTVSGSKMSDSTWELARKAKNLEEILDELDSNNYDRISWQGDILENAGYWQADEDTDGHGLWYPPNWKSEDGFGIEFPWDVIQDNKEMLTEYIALLQEEINRSSNGA